jgi:uncharacterized protein YkwD
VNALRRRSRNTVTFARTSAAVFALTAWSCAAVPPAATATKLVVHAPKLPLSEKWPPDTTPKDPVQKGVFDRINADRAAAGLSPVAWDEAAARVAEAYCNAQIVDGTRGHFLTDGVPPYARTAFAGISGMGSENAVAWITSSPSFTESPLTLALAGHADMMREEPPNDGHRKAILDPEATHVGVGYAVKGGSFRMAQEFLTRRLAELDLRSEAGTILVRGRTVSGYSLQFVTIAREDAPQKMTKEEARARNSYTYPDAKYSLVAEGRRSMRVVGTETDDRIHVGGTGDFLFRFSPTQAGLWTMIFYVAEAREKPHPGGLAVFWMIAPKE